MFGSQPPWRPFKKKIKIQTFWFQKNLKTIVQVNKDVMCMCVKFQEEIR